MDATPSSDVIENLRQMQRVSVRVTPQRRTELRRRAQDSLPAMVAQWRVLHAAAVGHAG